MTDNTPSRIDPAYAAAMPAPQGGALPTGLEWQALERMAHTLADSDVIPYRLKRKPADVAVILLAAREYGIPPLMALSKLPVVNGTPAPMGELMVALVLRAGHRIGATFRNPDGTVYAGGPLTREHYGEATYRRRDWDDDEALRFTIAEAINAGLVTLVEGRPHARDDKGRPTPWELYTPNMARWRAVANAARIAFADVLLGLSYLPEELGAIVDADGAPIRGEVVDVRQDPPTGTLEERTALEAADRLAEFVGPLEVLDNVLTHAEANGYADTRIEYADRQTGEQASTLREAIAHRRAWLEANTIDEAPETPPTPEAAPTATDDVVDADVVETPQEPATAPPAAEETPTGSAIDDGSAETPQEAAYDVAREALNTADLELVRTYYRGAGDLRGLDVLAVVGDDDLAAIDAPRDLEVLYLGSLLMAVAKYLEKHGTAVRDASAPMAPAPAGDDVEDPWAADAAAGWPSTPAP